MREPTPEEIEAFRITERTLRALDKLYHLMTHNSETPADDFRTWLLDEFEAEEMAVILCQVLPPQVMGMIALDSSPEKAWVSFYSDAREKGIDPASLS